MIDCDIYSIFNYIVYLQKIIILIFLMIELGPALGGYLAKKCCPQNYKFKLKLSHSEEIPIPGNLL